MNMNEQNTGKGKRIALIVLCVVLGIVLVGMLAVTVYAEYLLGRLNYADSSTNQTLSQEEIDAIQNGTDETLDPDFEGVEINEDDIDWGEVFTTIGNDENIVNVMLIGQDRRPGEARARSDSMILVTFNKRTKTITMTSFMRDLYVKIPGGYLDNRINVSYNLGGMELLDATLEENFGVIVDANVEVDFDQFEYLIDLLGGVEIDLSAAEARYINKKLKSERVTEGVNLLDGEEALWHARNRSTGGTSDFGRTDRQRTVLMALIEAYKHKSLTEMLGLLDDILPMVTTDLSKGEVITYVTALFPMLSECEFVTQHIPVDGGYQNATIRGMQVLVPYMDVNRQALVDSLTNAETE